MLTVRVKINIASQTTPQIIPVVQGDTGRSVLFEIADFVIPASATATYYIKKPSGQAVYNAATIDGNTVLADLTAQSIAEVGENPGQVRILKNDEVVTSFDFILDVEPFRGIDAIESTTEMNVFDQAVQQAMEEIDGSLENIVADEFDPNDSYLAGEYCLKSGTFYKFINNHTGAWSASDVEAITIGEALTEGGGGGGGGAVNSVNGKTGTVVLDAGDLEYDDEETYTSGTVGKEISNLNGDLNGKIDVPSTAGTNGQVLATDGDGGTYWTNSGGGGSSPSPYTSNPAALGTASPGSSDAYARGDHVHPKPTASDLGITVPSASSATPQALGTAAAGSSSDYSRADHVHAKPTASDIGAAPAVTEVTVATDGAVTQALDAGKIYHFTGTLTALTITLNAAASGQLAEYHFDFNCGSTAPTVTIPQTVTMPDSQTFDASKHYEVDILNNYGVAVAWGVSA